MGIGKLTGGRKIQILEEIRSNYPIVFHGVSLSIGSVDPLNFQYLESLKELINRFRPEWVSDHICWTGVHGENLHDLLPLPYTKETIDHLVGRIQQVQEFLGQRFIFENVSSYLSYAHSEMPEWEFISEIVRRSGCGLLLDVNNIYVSSVNHGFDGSHFLKGIPKSCVVQMHLAGFSDQGNYLLDAHNSAVSDPVWALYREACEIFGTVPTLIEWDAEIPSFQTLFDEAKKAKKIQEEFSINDFNIQAAT
jgi:uncharacterized protein (UPF0276 family)